LAAQRGRQRAVNQMFESADVAETVEVVHFSLVLMYLGLESILEP
jgi:hypothetical protein